MANSSRAHDRLQELLWGFAAHRILTVSERCGVLEALRCETGVTVDEVAGACGLASLPTRKIVRALTAMGVVEANGTRYRLTDDVSALFDPEVGSIASFLSHAHRMYESFGAHLEDWLKSGAWPRRERTAEETASFAEAMRGIGAVVARLAVETIDLEGAETMLDLGGGLGHYAEAFCDKNPGLRATVVDIPEVTALGERRMRARNATGRIAFEPGDYLTIGLETKFDFVLMANIVHQETEQRAAALIAHGAGFLKPGGRLAVLDFVIDERGEGPLVGALFAVNMRSFGDTYPTSKIEKWMKNAGLSELETRDIGKHRWVILGRKQL